MEVIFNAYRPSISLARFHGDLDRTSHTLTHFLALCETGQDCCEEEGRHLQAAREAAREGESGPAEGVG